jgi:4-carboxymuconolactone decarboxylase
MKRNAEVGLITKSSILNGKEQQFMDKQKFDQGLAVRREVLGDEYVDKAVAATTDFTRPMQELLNENCWGTIWTRPGLPRKTRSLVTLAFLSALRATTEIKSHVRGALRNGCTVQEIQEVLLQASVYVGVPAGIEAFRAAKEVIYTWKDERP